MFLNLTGIPVAERSVSKEQEGPVKLKESWEPGIVFQAD
jgi:hypothetical protein